jgi:hypothetical protein
MIAPLRETNGPDTRRALRSARLAVAAALLGDEQAGSAKAGLVPNWQAWTFVGWMTFAAAAYLACRFQHF